VGRFDVLITDTDMPRKNGLALVRAVQAEGFAGRIIVRSPQLGADEKQLFQSCGVATFIPKLSSPEVLIAAIASHA
jgi:DNA-binding NarL/FixJ family response regulator